MEIEGGGNKPKRKNQEGNRVQLVKKKVVSTHLSAFVHRVVFVAILYSQLMLQSWNNSIFSNVRDKLLLAAMKFLYAERNGEAFDSQLVIGVRESFGESDIYEIACLCVFAREGAWLYPIVTLCLCSKFEYRGHQ